MQAGSCGFGCRVPPPYSINTNLGQTSNFKRELHGETGRSEALEQRKCNISRLNVDTFNISYGIKIQCRSNVTVKIQDGCSSSLPLHMSWWGGSTTSLFTYSPRNGFQYFKRMICTKDPETKNWTANIYYKVATR